MVSALVVVISKLERLSNELEELEEELESKLLEEELEEELESKLLEELLKELLEEPESKLELDELDAIFFPNQPN